MKILLINAASPLDPLKKNHPFMPLALPILAATAPEHDYTFVDMLSNDKINFNEDYDIVGISLRITAEETAKQISNKFRKKNTKVIIGGPQASCSPITIKKFADSVVIGEAEELWPVILNDIKNNKMKDFYVCSPNKFKIKKHTVFQKNKYPDFKNYPIPLRKLYTRNYMFNTVFAARGCPINCDFCSVTTIFGGKTRLRKIDDVVNEIKSFKGYYYILDDTVFGRPDTFDYYIELYDKISKLKKIHFWTGQANLDAASYPKGREVIKKARDAGLVYAAIGLESINEKMQIKSNAIKKMGVGKKDDYILKIKENIKFIQDQGIIISGWFTIGFDDDDYDTFYNTLDFCKETHLLPVINPLEVIPNTRLYDKLIKQNRITDNKHINIIHPKMTDDKKVVNIFRDIIKKGYSIANILKNTFYYFSKFDKETKNIHRKRYNIISKTCFCFFLQFKLKKGLIVLANEESNLKK